MSESKCLARCLELFRRSGTWLVSVIALDLILEDLVVVLRYQDANGERHEPESCPRLSSYVGVYSNFIDG